MEEAKKGCTLIAFICIFVMITWYIMISIRSLNTVEDLLVLQYGDACNPKHEEMWNNASLSGIYARKDENRDLIYWAALEAAFQKKMYLCDSLSQLKCNKSIGRCDCGGGELYTELGEASSKRFVTERRVHQGVSCRWAEGNYCVPREFYKRMRIPWLGTRMEDACAEGTTCRIRRSKKICTIEAFSDYLTEDRDAERNWEPIYSGKICTCQMDDPTLGILTVLSK